MSHIYKNCCLLFLLISSALLFPAQAREQNAYPGINLPFENPDFEEWVQRFEREGREIYDRRHEIVDSLDLKPGTVIADIGAGTGLFTKLFSPKVGVNGKVYAVDISKVFVDNIRRLSREMGLDNVEAVLNTPDDVKLPYAAVDIAFICDTYHHFEYPQTTLASIHRSLRLGGELIVIDYRKLKGTSSNWVMSHVRADKAAVIKEIEAAGFEFIEEEDILRTNYFLRFRRIELMS